MYLEELERTPWRRLVPESTTDRMIITALVETQLHDHENEVVAHCEFEHASWDGIVAVTLGLRIPRDHLVPLKVCVILDDSAREDTFMKVVPVDCSTKTITPCPFQTWHGHTTLRSLLQDKYAIWLVAELRPEHVGEGTNDIDPQTSKGSN